MSMDEVNGSGHGNAEVDLIFLSDGRMGAKKFKKSRKYLSNNLKLMACSWRGYIPREHMEC